MNMNRPFRPVSLADPLPKGMGFVRAMIAMAVNPKSLQAARAYAATRWGEDSVPERILKTAVGAGSTDDIGSDVLAAQTEFMNAVRAQTAIGTLMANGLRRRPAATRYLVNTGPMRGSWVAEGAAIPLLPVSVEQATIQLLKVAGIVVLTKESLQSSDPAAEVGIRADIISGLAEAVDTAFLDPTNAGSAGVTPAAVTNGLTPIGIGTGDLDDVRQGISRMIEEFEGDLSRAVFVGSPQLFAMLHAQGYEDVGIRGGVLVGAPAVATKGMPASASGFYQLALIDPAGIAYADDPSRTEITASQQASLEMADNPAGSSVPPNGVSLVSMFQTNCVALRGMLHANWSVEREGAVSLMLAFPEALS